MGRDPHRAPGRLAPLRSDYDRGTLRSPSRQPVNLPPPERPTPQAPHLPPDQGADDVIEGEVYDYDYESPVREPRTIAAPDCRMEEDDQPAWTADDTQPMMRVFAAAHRHPPTPVPEPDPSAMLAPDSLSVQERHRLLIHTISLYETDWKLAGIRANPKNDHVQAFLIPRNRKYNLKEAISRNQALMITIDPRGNTEIKEPKKKGLLRRFINWLWGE
jgi:hypothetical protein